MLLPQRRHRCCQARQTHQDRVRQRGTEASAQKTLTGGRAATAEVRHASARCQALMAPIAPSSAERRGCVHCHGIQAGRDVRIHQASACHGFSSDTSAWHSHHRARGAAQNDTTMVQSSHFAHIRCHRACPGRRCLYAQVYLWHTQVSRYMLVRAMLLAATLPLWSPAVANLNATKRYAC